MLKSANLVVLLTGTMVFAAGCSPESSTRPEELSINATASASSVVTETIGTPGGELASSGATFVVAANGFSSSETVSLTALGGGEFALDSTSSVFPGIGILTIALPSGADPQDAHEIREYDPLTGNWSAVTGSQSGNTVSVSVDHPATFDLTLQEM